MQFAGSANHKGVRIPHAGASLEIAAKHTLQATLQFAGCIAFHGRTTGSYNLSGQRLVLPDSRRIGNAAIA
jgi:hypothetical protein